MDNVNTDGVCNLAWQMNIDIAEWYDLPFTRYSSTPLFRKLAITEKYKEMYEYAFGNLSATEVPKIMAKLDHSRKDVDASRAGMVLVVIMVIVVVLRLHTRILLMTGRLKVEDWLIIVGTVFTIIMEGFTWTITIKGGAGKHFYDVTQRENYTILKFSWFLMLFYNLTMIPVKLSFLLVYASLYFNCSRKFRWICYTVCCIVVVGNLTFVGFSFTCKPFDFWNHINDVWEICPNSDLWDISSSGYNVASDLLIFLIPVTLVVRMPNLSKRDKVALIALFAVGALVCVTALTRIWQIKLYQLQPDWTPYAPLMFFLYTAEPTLAIIASCLPAMRILFLHFRNNYTTSPPPSSHDLSAGGDPSGGAVQEYPRKRRGSHMLRRRELDSVKELDVNASRTVDRLIGVRSIIRWAYDYNSKDTKSTFWGSSLSGSKSRTESDKSATGVESHELTANAADIEQGLLPQTPLNNHAPKLHGSDPEPVILEQKR